VKEKDVLLSSTRAKLESLQADHCASDDTVSGLEELLADKDKQIERFAAFFTATLWWLNMHGGLLEIVNGLFLVSIDYITLETIYSGLSRSNFKDHYGDAVI